MFVIDSAEIVEFHAVLAKRGVTASVDAGIAPLSIPLVGSHRVGFRTARVTWEVVLKGSGRLPRFAYQDEHWRCVAGERAVVARANHGFDGGDVSWWEVLLVVHIEGVLATLIRGLTKHLREWPDLDTFALPCLRYVEQLAEVAWRDRWCGYDLRSA